MSEIILPFLLVVFVGTSITLVYARVEERKELNKLKEDNKSILVDLIKTRHKLSALQLVTRDYMQIEDTKWDVT